MLKQFVVYLIMSALVVLFAHYIQVIILNIDLFFALMNAQLSPVFSQTGFGPLTRRILVLIILPLIIVGIPALIYKAIRKKEMPHLIASTWIVWTIIVLSDILNP